MAEKKSGPVKPPIIDAQARSADKPISDRQAPESAPAGEGAKASATGPSKTSPTERVAPKPAASGPDRGETGAPESGAAKPGAPGSDAPKAEPAKPPQSSKTRPASPAAPAPAQAPTPWLPLMGASVAGALLGLGLAYGFASFGLWPHPAPSAQGEIADLQSRAARMENALALRESEAADTSARIDDLAAGLAAIEPAEPASTDDLAARSDLEALAARIDDLSARMEAVLAGASGDEASQIAENLSALSAQVAALSERLDAIEPQAAQIAPAMERLDDLDARIADQADFDAMAADRDRIARLPAALSALQTAITSGEPFANELAEIEALLPGLSVPEQARAVAAGGAPGADALLERLRNAIPAILGARPGEATGNWAQDLFDQAAAALALRPTDGDTPEGLVGRTEAALQSGDLRSARAAFTALPEPMQAAAPGFAEDLARASLAHDVLAAARSADPATPEQEPAQ